MLTNFSPTLQALDPHEFSDRIEPHRRELQAHCYRLLGSVQEAEDLVQETMLRAWRGRETYQGRAPLRAWLYKIATNVCLDALAKRPHRTVPVARGAAASPNDPVPPPITEPIWLEPFPEDLLTPDSDQPEARYSIHESVTLAFLTSLQLLPPRQRAILILRDVLDWEASEVAEALGVSVAAIKSALHRARETLSRQYRAVRLEDMTTQQIEIGLRDQLERYVRAWEAADADGLTALLKTDATFSMPPTPTWYQGRDSIRLLVAQTVFVGQPKQRWRLLPTRANHQPAFGVYRFDEAQNVYAAYGIQVLTIVETQIADIITFRVPDLVARFNLPKKLLV